MGAEKPDEERMTGTIKEIDGDIVTVVCKGPEGKRQEIDVPRKGIGKSSIAVGDIVTVEFSRLKVEVTIPTTGPMLGIEDAIMDALGLIREDLFEQMKPKKKAPAKRPKRT